MQEDFRNRLCRSGVKMHSRPVLDQRRASQQFQPRVDAPRLRETSPSRQHHASLHCGVLDPRKIHRRALSRVCALDGLAPGLHAAHAQQLSFRQQFHFVPDRDLPRNQGARDHRPKSLHGKRSVDGQAKVAPRLFLGDRPSRCL